MGNDGGTTATRRDCMTKKKKNPKKLNLQNAALLNWTTCRLSNEKFTPTDAISACKLGFLFKKETLIQTLMDKTKKMQLLAKSPHFNHIRSLKDVCDVKFTMNPDYTPDSGDAPSKKYLFMCPISQRPITGTHKFCLFRSCGHVVSEEAMQNMNFKNNKNEECKCLVCGATNTLLTPLNPSNEEIDKLRTELTDNGEISKKAKENKKKRKIEDNDPENPSKKRKIDGDSSTNEIDFTKSSSSSSQEKISKKIEEKKQQSAVYSSIFN